MTNSNSRSQPLRLQKPKGVLFKRVRRNQTGRDLCFFSIAPVLFHSTFYLCKLVFTFVGEGSTNMVHKDRSYISCRIHKATGTLIRREIKTLWISLGEVLVRGKDTKQEGPIQSRVR